MEKHIKNGSGNMRINTDIAMKLNAFKVYKTEGRDVAFRLYPELIFFIETNRHKKYNELEKELAPKAKF